MLGIGAASVTLNLDRTHFNIGDEITGTVGVKINDSIGAEGVSVRLTQEETFSSFNGRDRISRTINLYDFTLPLEGPKNFRKTDVPIVYPFKLKIPNTLPKAKDIPEGMLGDILKTVTEMAKQGKIAWYVEAKLDIPKAFDATKRIEISVLK